MKLRFLFYYKNFNFRSSFAPSEIGETVESFLNNLSCILSEKEFIIDYHNLYPVTDDIETLFELNADMYP